MFPLKYFVSPWLIPYVIQGTAGQALRTKRDWYDIAHVTQTKLAKFLYLTKYATSNSLYDFLKGKKTVCVYFCGLGEVHLKGKGRIVKDKQVE